MKKAFTFIEVLMAIAIIVLVAMIFLPNLYESYMEKDRINKAQRGYANLSNAITTVKSWGGDYIFYQRKDNEQNLQEWFEEYLKPNLRVDKSCYNSIGCWSEDNNIGLNGNNVYENKKDVGIGSNIITAVLDDGTFINIDLVANRNVWNHYGIHIDCNYAIVLFYDVNGAKKPNVVGKDIFVAVYTEVGLVPAFRDETANFVIADCSKIGTGYSCLRMYLKK